MGWRPASSLVRERSSQLLRTLFTALQGSEAYMKGISGACALLIHCRNGFHGEGAAWRLRTALNSIAEPAVRLRQFGTFQKARELGGGIVRDCWSSFSLPAPPLCGKRVGRHSLFLHLPSAGAHSPQVFVLWHCTTTVVRS